MDTRLIILAVTFALVVVSIIILIVALVRSGRPKIPAEGVVAAPGDWPALNPAPAELEDAHDVGPFNAPKSGMAAVLSQPLRTGTWRPDAPGPTATPVVSAGDYWDSLIDEPELLLREPAAQAETVGAAVQSPAVAPTASPAPAPTQVQVPVSAPSPAPPMPEKPAAPPVAEAAPAPVAETPPAAVSMAEPAPLEAPLPQTPPAQPSTVETAPETAQPPATPYLDAQIDVQDQEWLVDLVAELDAAQPVPVAAPVVQPAPAPEPQPVAEPAPVVVPVAVAQPMPVEPVAQPAPAPAPVAVPLPEPASEPVAPLPDVVAPRPVAPPPAPRPAVSVPTEPIPPAQEPRPQVIPAARPAEPRPAAVIHSEPVEPPERVAAVPSAPSMSADRLAASEQLILVAPVEMWFGEARVGVKPGSNTYDRFQRIAKVLFDDLKQATSGS